MLESSDRVGHLGLSSLSITVVFAAAVYTLGKTALDGGGTGSATAGNGVFAACPGDTRFVVARVAGKAALVVEAKGEAVSGVANVAAVVVGRAGVERIDPILTFLEILNCFTLLDCMTGSIGNVGHAPYL